MKLREGGIAWREVDGETLLLDLATSKYLSVNPSATVLWRQLAVGTTRADLIDALVAEYGIGEDDAGADVDAFLADCRAREYLEDDEQQ